MVMPPNNKTEAMMGFQDEVNKDPINALNMIQGGLSSVPPNVEQ